MGLSLWPNLCCSVDFLVLLVCLHRSNLRALKISALTSDWRKGTSAKDQLLCKVKGMESMVAETFVVAKNEIVLSIKTLS